MWKPTSFGYWTPLNLAKVICYGGDYAITAIFTILKTKFKTSATYSFTKSENYTIPASPNDHSYRTQLPFIPLHAASGFLFAEYRKYYLTLRANFYSTRFTTTDASSSPLNTLKPLFLTNSSLGKIFNYKDLQFDVSFCINNLFNKKYYSVLMQPMPGINFAGSFSIRFR
jgi:iron complex outermembrane receptor protein